VLRYAEAAIVHANDAKDKMGLHGIDGHAEESG